MGITPPKSPKRQRRIGKHATIQNKPKFMSTEDYFNFKIVEQELGILSFIKQRTDGNSKKKQL